MLGVAEVYRARPSGTILLAGVSTDLFYAGVVDVPFRVMEIPRVYLVPGAEASIQAPAGLAGKFVLPEALAARELDNGRAVVYDASGPVLRNVTGRYRAAAAGWVRGTPDFINVADPIFAGYLGPGWGEARDGYRPMQNRASLRIAGPRHSGERLWLGIFSTRRTTPRVLVAGREVAPGAGERYAGRVDWPFPLPPELTGRPEIEVTIEADAGLTFGFAEVR